MEWTKTKNYLQALSCLLVSSLLLTACEGNDSDSISGTSGQSGSLAAMVVAGGQLHILNNDKVNSFDLSGELILQETAATSNSFWSAETLMNYQDKYLLIGTDTGVIVYDFQNQVEVSRVSHIQARDPVIASGINGYFTTRDSDDSFGSVRDTVNIMDLSNVENTTLTYTTEVLKEPLGLALYGEQLFVCDLAAGLSRFTIVKNAEGKATELEYISSNANLPCNDIIVRDDLVILIDSFGAIQFTMTNDELNILSEIY